MFFFSNSYAGQGHFRYTIFFSPVHYSAQCPHTSSHIGEVIAEPNHLTARFWDSGSKTWDPRGNLRKPKENLQSSTQTVTQAQAFKPLTRVPTRICWNPPTPCVTKMCNLNHSKTEHMVGSSGTDFLMASQTDGLPDINLIIPMKRRHFYLYGMSQ